ncbi:MAG TPA: sigma 54-interacting transcriptional regulator [Pyrinomonadaceae bacterium]|jgi:DNA-binding NtrC family response regulator
MASLYDSHCRLAFLGERDDENFLEPLSTQTAVHAIPDRKFFHVRQREEYKDFGCNCCVLYSPTGSVESIIPLVDSAAQSRENLKLILLLLKQDTTRLEKALKETGRSVQIILLKEPKVSPAAELINSYLIAEEMIKPPGDDWKFVGASEPVQKLYHQARRFACWDRDPVLILGQTGTGKELVAKYIHKRSRAKYGFYPQNLAALPLELTESLLFGYEKGTFTGALAAGSKGLILNAGKGTLFLDEIGETPPAIQAKLLRVLQERKVRRLGGEARLEDVLARFVFATNRELRELKEACRRGKFREDFLQRIDVLQIRVPPLSERREDIPRLVNYFVKEVKDDYRKASQDESVKCEGVAANELYEKVKDIKVDNLFKLIDVLFDYDWPGNVRELRGVVVRAMAETQAETIDQELGALIAEKQKEREREQAEPKATGRREHSPHYDERTHAFGSFVKLMLTKGWGTAEHAFADLYKQNLFFETGGDDQLMALYSRMRKAWRNKLKTHVKRSKFKRSDLKGADTLVIRFKENSDPVSTYIHGNFERLVSVAENQRNGSHPPTALVDCLVRLLNDLRKDQEFYQPELFRQVALSDEAKGLIENHGLLTDLMALNRILIEDVYPEAIVKNESLRAEVRVWLSSINPTRRA